LVDDLVASNNISVPDDYTIPEISDEQIQEMMKNQQQNPMGGSPGGQAPPVQVDPQKKPDVKKKTK